MSDLSPLNNYVVATPVKPATKTASGLYLPENAQSKTTIGLIVAVGKDVADVKEGDQIIFKGFNVTEVEVNSTEYLLIKDEDILAKVN